MKNLLFLLSLIFTPIVKGQQIQHPDFFLEDKNIIIAYDLVGCNTNDLYDVSVVFVDQNQTKITPISLSGDVKKVSCGSKRIVWNVLNDRRDFSGKYQVWLYVEVKSDFKFTENVKIMDPIAEEIPVFVDEEATFSDVFFLSQHLKYPERAILEQLEGRCYLSFIVDEFGKISNISVLRGVPSCPECDEEAKRVIGLMPNWTPAKLNGKVTKSNGKAVVKFQLAN